MANNPIPTLRACSRSLSERIAELGSLPAVVAGQHDLGSIITGAGAVIARSLEIDELLVAVLSGAGDRVDLWCFDRTGGLLGPTVVLADSDIGVSAAVHRGAPSFGIDTATSDHPGIAALAQRGLSRAVMVPMVTNDRPVGALVAARLSGDLDQPDLRSLELAACVVGSAVELHQRTEVAQRADAERNRTAMVLDRRAEEMGALGRVADALERFEVGHAVAVLSVELASLRGSELCRITAQAPDGSLVPVSVTARFGPRVSDARNRVDPRDPDALAVASARAVLWRRPDPGDLVALDGLHRLAVTSALAVPVLWEGRSIGAVMVGSTGGHRLVTDEHLVVVELASRMLAVAIGGSGGWRAPLARNVPGSRLVGAGMR